MMDTNKSKFWYFFFVVVGFILTVALINYLTKSKVEAIETFEVTPPPAVDMQLEDIVQDMPRKSKLAMYLTAFSEPATFQCDTNYWCDATNPSTKFFILSDTTLPATLTPATGLPLNGIMLRGPSAYTLAPTAPHVLESFTLIFYAKIKSLSALDQTDANQANTITLWDLPAESPHKVKLFIRPTYNADGTVNTSTAGISCTFGSECDLVTTTNVWEFNRSTLISTVDTPTLFALVFNKEEKLMQFYAGINAAPMVSRFVGDVVPEIRLGISEMMINRQKNWDANLVAMAYYNAALPVDDLRILDRYFMQHSTGYTTMVRAKETLETQIQDLMSRLNTGEDTIRELLDKLNAANQTCTAVTSNQEMVDKLRRWHIKMEGNADISTNDLGKCSILGVKSFGAKAADINEAAPTSTATASSTTTSNNRKYNIPYPSEVTVSTPSSSIYTAESSTPTPRLPTAPVDTNDSNGFWKSFFDFMKNQTAKTDETEEKVDLNKAYDQLRDEVNTDRTQAGSGAALKASVQDPPKKEEPVKEETSGFWQTIKSIFADL